jgi:probable RNA-binding protein EIF1AD
MSGSGRKSSYRKSITDKFDHDYPLPASSRDVVRIRSCRGANIFEVESCNGDIDLAMLPNKFKNLIWIKRDDYVLVESNIAELPVPVDDPSSSTSSSSSSTGKMKFIVKTILSKDQIKYIKAQNLWPIEFDAAIGKNEAIATDNKGSLSKDDLMPGYNSEEDIDDVAAEEDLQQADEPSAI